MHIISDIPLPSSGETFEIGSILPPAPQPTGKVLIQTGQDISHAFNALKGNNTLYVYPVSAYQWDDATWQPRDAYIDRFTTWEQFSFVYCMLYTGMRIAEVLALTWDKIDFDAKTIRVDSAVKKHKERNSNCKSRMVFKIGKPKTKNSVRTVPMSEDLKCCLLKWRDIQCFIAEDKSNLGLLFPKPNGKLFNYDAYQEAFSNFLKGLNIEHTIYHSRVFRHTYASYLVKQGIKPKTLQKLLGHSNVETTLKYYVDTDMEQVAQSTLMIDQALRQENDFVFNVAI